MQALRHCHAMDVCHRDVKLENMVFDPATCHARLIDFGLSLIWKPGDPLIRKGRSSPPLSSCLVFLNSSDACTLMMLRCRSGGVSTLHGARSSRSLAGTRRPASRWRSQHEQRSQHKQQIENIACAHGVSGAACRHVVVRCVDSPNEDRSTPLRR